MPTRIKLAVSQLLSRLYFRAYFAYTNHMERFDPLSRRLTLRLIAAIIASGGYILFVKSSAPETLLSTLVFLTTWCGGFTFGRRTGRRLLHEAELKLWSRLILRASTSLCLIVCLFSSIHFVLGRNTTKPQLHQLGVVLDASYVSRWLVQGIIYGLLLSTICALVAFLKSRSEWKPAACARWSELHVGAIYTVPGHVYYFNDTVGQPMRYRKLSPYYYVSLNLDNQEISQMKRVYDRHMEVIVMESARYR